MEEGMMFSTVDRDAERRLPFRSSETWPILTKPKDVGRSEEITVRTVKSGQCMDDLNQRLDQSGQSIC